MGSGLLQRFYTVVLLLSAFLSSCAGDAGPLGLVAEQAKAAAEVAGRAVGCGTGGSTPCPGGEVTTPWACLSGATQIECAATPLVVNGLTHAKVGLDSKVLLPLGQIAKNDALVVDFDIKNVASVVTAAALKIIRVEVDYAPATSAEFEDGPAIRCTSMEGVDCASNDDHWADVVPVGISPNGLQKASEKFRLTFKRIDDLPRTAKVVILFGGVGMPYLAGYAFTVQTKIGLPAAKFQSTDASDALDTVSLPLVAAATQVTKDFKLLNTGESTLQVSGFDLTNLDSSFGFRLIGPPDLDGDSHPGGAIWTLTTPLVVPPGSSATLNATFTRSDDKKHAGSLSIKKTSNDPSASDLWIEVSGP